MAQEVKTSGIRAVARGALEAGVEFAAGYPGGPITGIMAGLFAEASPRLHVEWCPNEKDAVAGAFGAALVGRRALAVGKHVGLSVASDAGLAGPAASADTGTGTHEDIRMSNDEERRDSPQASVRPDRTEEAPEPPRRPKAPRPPGTPSTRVKKGIG